MRAKKKWYNKDLYAPFPCATSSAQIKSDLSDIQLCFFRFGFTLQAQCVKTASPDMFFTMSFQKVHNSVGIMNHCAVTAGTPEGDSVYECSLVARNKLHFNTH